MNMKIFLNTDKNNNLAKKTEKTIHTKAKELNIQITNQITESDIIFSIGGDGTFLKTARIACEKPILGINTGTLGYLTQTNPQNLEKTLENLINNNYSIEKRMMIEGQIIKKNKQKIRIPESLNEIAISKNTFGIIRFNATINGKLINSYTADGILVCTPTGSTAYNLSCGGPIADPTAEILTLTPIAPHTMINRSIILSENSIIEIKITELRENTNAYVLYDGKAIEIFNEDTIQIKKSDKITRIIKFEDKSFIDTIRKKIN